MTHHRHQWTTLDFILEAERPMVRQACACGAERCIRAWERYWTPTDQASGDRDSDAHERYHS